MTQLRLTALRMLICKIDVDIYAENYREQQTKVINRLKKIFQCGNFEAEYYNNALRYIKEVATQQNVKDRRVSKTKILNY